MSAVAEESAPEFLFLILTIHNRGVYACFIPGGDPKANSYKLWVYDFC